MAHLKGVGPARARMLEAKGLLTVEDLLYYVPFRYEDRTNTKPIAQLAPGEMATLVAEVASAHAVRFRRSGARLFEVRARDGSGGTLVCKWFRGDYLADVLKPGQRVAFYGKIEFDNYAGELSILHPEYEILSGEGENGESALHVNRIVPIYEAAGKVTTRVFRVLVHRVLEGLGLEDDPLPEPVRARLALPARAAALREAHFPPPGADLRLLNSYRTPAQVRLIFEEFFYLECGLALKRRKARSVEGIAFALNDAAREKIKAILPFKPTAAQKRVLKEIATDMSQPQPMNRLLQGDVGSGKTIVALEAAIIALENGYQVALMAPTEILATQHYLYSKRILEKAGYVVLLLTGAFSESEKAKLKRLIAAGLAHVVIGTHALIEGDVEFARLGLVIIDEQHRFGVMQRLKLLQKGKTPDVLVMTATPIPRTLALTVYGDLDVSVIDELPPGRRPIETRHFTEDSIEEVYSFVRREIEQGRQAYVVYPVIEESETRAIKAAEKMFHHLSRTVFPDLVVALLHGRLAAAEKDGIMEDFKARRIDILVATTVIEVGVDVPNATVMVIEQAESFGLAQLHQLRGRVGRGADQSYCLLVTGELTEAARERLRTMLETTDGFRIAEMDLRLRGPGEFFGTRQSGLPALRVANL
ncbi:MAG TPA: ATP-dependent DNA helicase RecG, partial [Bryobacterales bacterium]|nr:ATP-dependent DNA helicase RecG [Bryobacterales bacterium]